MFSGLAVLQPDPRRGGELSGGLRAVPEQGCNSTDISLVVPEVVHKPEPKFKISIGLPPRRRKSRAEEEGKEGKRPSEEEQYDFFTKVGTLQQISVIQTTKKTR